MRLLLATISVSLGLQMAAAAPTMSESSLMSRQATTNQQYVGYLFLHFYDDYNGPGQYNTYPAGEQVFGHLSNGNNLLDYKAMNNGAPLLTSTVGTRGVRDFYLASKPDESQHYIIATDLNQTAAGGFNGNFLSRSLVIWESQGSSLTQWSQPRLVEVVPPEFRMAWAPEAVWVPDRNQFMVFWSSNKYTDAQHTGEADYDKVYRAYTSDFKTFTTPEVYYDFGKAIIDMTISQVSDQQYVRFLKDETVQKCFGELSNNGLDGQWTRMGAADQYVDNDNRGEACLIINDNTDASKWTVFQDEYFRTPTGYYPYSASSGITNYGYTAESSPGFPGMVKHGTIKKITQAQYDELSGNIGQAFHTQ
ncbi:unnamed protein product [Jaminaea pallidilutea]